MVVRDYIVQHYGFDDTKLKTFALGKQTTDDSKGNWGLIRVLIYPVGTPVPQDKSKGSTATVSSPADSK